MIDGLAVSGRHEWPSYPNVNCSPGKACTLVGNPYPQCQVNTDSPPDSYALALAIVGVTLAIAWARRGFHQRKHKL